MKLDPLRTAVEPYLGIIRAVLILLLVIGLVWRGYSWGSQRWEAKFDGEVAAHKATKADFKRMTRDLADRTKALAAKAKAASTAAKAARKTNDQRFEDAEREADRAKRDLRDALRRGTGPMRLRDEWACGGPGAGQGDAAAASGGQDAAADLRAAGAADLVAAGDAADRWIVWLQSELITTRTACGIP